MLRAWLGMVIAAAIVSAGLIFDRPLQAFIAFLLVGASGWIARLAKAALRRQSSAGTQSPFGPSTFLFLAVAIRVQSLWASLAALALLTAWALALRARRQLVIQWLPALPVVAVVTTIVLVFGQNPSASLARDALVMLALAGFILVLSLSRFSPTDTIVQLAEGLGVYLIASVVLYVVGIQSPSEGTRLGLDNASGIFDNRALFPFALSYVSAPVVAAGFLASLPGLSLVMGNSHRVFRYAATAAAVFVILAGGYRSPLVFGVLIALAALLQPRLLTRVAPICAVVVLTLPLWYTALAQPVNSAIAYVESYGHGLQEREGATSALSNRDIVWRRSLDTIAAEPRSAQVLGYGADGHITSGAAARYSFVLEGLVIREAAKRLPPHSTILQVLFDGGLVGATAILAAIWLILYRLCKLLQTGYLAALAASGATLAFATGGATEIVLAPTPSFQEPFLFVALLALTLTQVPIHAAPSEGAPSDRSRHVGGAMSVMEQESARTPSLASPTSSSVTPSLVVEGRKNFDFVSGLDSQREHDGELGVPGQGRSGRASRDDHRRAG